MNQLTDILDQDLDPAETQEWTDALKGVINADGTDRAHFLLERMVDETRRAGGYLPFEPTTEYVNTIPPHLEVRTPGDPTMEWRIRSLIRWNAMAMVVRANRKPGDLGGHIASFASSATLYDVGFNHFWRAPSDEHPGDLVFHQGHSSPGVYARSYLEGRIDEQQLDFFRMEVAGKGRGLSSYPHPWLMPDYWQVPTVSMGLGPLQAIYQAHFWKYLENRGLIRRSDRKVWCFIGDGESDEPESLGAISLAGREGLDNLDLRRQLQPAAPRRPGARQRQDHPGARRRVPRRRLERDQGGLGQLLGSAARARHERHAAQADDGNGRRRIPELQGLRRRVHARAFLRQVPGDARDGRQSFRRRHLAPEPRRPRSAQGLRGLSRGREHEGHADRDPRQDGQGLRHGRGRRIAEPDASAEEARQRGRARVPRPLPAFRSPTTRSTTCRTTTPARIRRKCSTCSSARNALGGFLPQRRRRAHRSLDARSRRVRALYEVHRRSRDLHHDGLRARHEPASCATSRSARASCRSSPTRRARSAWKACSARSASTRRSARSTSRSTPTSSCTTARTQKGQVLQEGITEPGAMSAWMAAATELLGQQRADAAVLHLLLDVRLPAHRRPRLAGGRHARARLPARRHRGPHHA